MMKTVARIPRQRHHHNFATHAHKVKGSRARYRCTDCPCLSPWRDHTTRTVTMARAILTPDDSSLPEVVVDLKASEPEVALTPVDDKDEPKPQRGKQIVINFLMKKIDALSDDKLENATKADLLSIAMRNSVEVYKSWTKARIIEKLREARVLAESRLDRVKAYPKTRTRTQRPHPTY